MTKSTPTPRRSRLPILQGLLPIPASQVPAEILAGITVAALAIPEVMGYTKIAGMPVVTGLYTILIPTALFAVFGSSRHLVVGADSATAAILAAGLVGLAATGSQDYVALAALLALLAAGFLLLARFARLGFLADFLSRTVLIGFLTGVGIQVALGQISGMLGLEAEGHGTLGEVWADLRHIGQANPYSAAIALAVILVIVGSKRISHKIPGALIAVAGAIAVSWQTDLQALAPVLGTVPSGLPHLGLPQVSWSWDLIGRLLPTAFSMFVVILAQSAATSRAYALRYNEPFSENTDLVGLGLANLGAGLSGSFVVNGSPTKTQMADQAGGRTQFSLLVTVLAVLAVLLFLTEPLALLPKAVLSAIVFLIGIGLIDLRGMRDIFRRRPAEFWVALATLLAVVLVGVEQGIFLAIALSLIVHTRHGYRPKTAVIVPAPSGALHPQPKASLAEAVPGLMIYRFTHSIYYANAAQLSEEVRSLAEDARPPLRWFCFDLSAVDDVDYSASKSLASLCDALRTKGIRPVFAQLLDDINPGVRADILGLVGPDAIYESLEEVMQAYRRSSGG